MNELLRQYERWECGSDGYPQMWHMPSAMTLGGFIYGLAAENLAREFPEAELRPAIKDLIRELAGHRCLRCGHPYRKGENERGEWSACSEDCTHGLPLRVRQPQEGKPDAILRHETGKSNWRPAGKLVAISTPRGHIVEAHWRILTVHHLDEDKTNCRWWNLASLCQRCHLRMQRAVVMDRVYHFEHTEWFRPFAAGFYAFKYLGEDLTREETMERLDELLALEHRFTQEALL